MPVRRTFGKRTRNAFNEIFKSQSKSQLRYLKWIFLVLCLITVFSMMGYQIYSLRNIKYRSYKSSGHQSEIQSFMNPDYKAPNNKQLRQTHAEKFRENNGNNAYKSGLSSSMLHQLHSAKTAPSKLRTPHEDIMEYDKELSVYTQLSWEEQCESSSFQEKDFYDQYINTDDIDYIFPADDAELYDTLHSDAFLNHWDTSYIDNTFWKGLYKLDKEHKKEVKVLQEKYEEYNAMNGNQRLVLGRRSPVGSYFDFNGLASDLTHFDKNIESTGADGEYWWTADTCVHHKSCDVYNINRVLMKSKLISCKEILTEILPPLYECIKEYGKKCEHVIDSGYYRVILQSYYGKIGEQIVIKMMKTKSIKKPRDIIRHLRESILLGRLYDLEETYLLSASDERIFTQSLNNGKSQKERGFNYVEEYGHCVTPLWISISPKYKVALDKWIFGGFAAQSTLKKLIFMSLQIASSVELLHTIPGGPFHHTDIQPRQFLLDDNDNVYINDFNRGKFQPYYFDEDGTTTKCWYCGHRSRGHWRAPEEPKKRPLNEKLDIFSMGLTIWALYAMDVPFRDASFDELEWLFYDLRRIPPMTDNMPPAIKDIIRLCLTWNPRNRPTASQVVKMLENIYYHNLKVVTEGFMDYTSDQLLELNAWSETNYPPLEKRKDLLVETNDEMK